MAASHQRVMDGARNCKHLTPLLRPGAKLVENVSDVVEELPIDTVGHSDDLFTVANHPAKTARSTLSDLSVLDDDYVTVLDAMGYDPVSVDELVACTGLTPQALSSMLLALELRGIVHPVSGIGYVRAAS